MLDAMSLDQLRTFIAAADEGSFSAAGRKLRRAQSVVSTTLADLGAKHAFLKAGLGWGYMPLHMVEDDLRSGKLVRIEVELHVRLGPGFSMHAIHRKDHPPGPAGRWFVNHLKQR